MQALLEFLFSGSYTSMSDISHLEEERLRIAQTHMSHIDKARLDRSGNWNGFLEKITSRFPLRHRANFDVRESINARMADFRDDSEARRFRPRGEFSREFNNPFSVNFKAPN